MKRRAEKLDQTIAELNGIGVCLDNLPALADVRPQGGIVEVAAMGLAHRVIEILYVGEYSDLLHQEFLRGKRTPIMGEHPGGCTFPRSAPGQLEPPQATRYSGRPFTADARR